MEAITRKNVTTVQGSVIVHQQDVARFHTEGGNVLFTGAFDFVAVLQREGFHCIGVKNFGHAHFGDTTGATVPQFTSVVVGVVEPNGQTSHGVTVDGGFRLLDGLCGMIERL